MKCLCWILRLKRGVWKPCIKRLLIINYKLFVGNRREILSVPYNKIVSISLEIENSDVIFSINTTNVYELEIKISKPISLDDVYNVYSYITNKIS